MIYLASPYTHHSPAVQEYRYKEAYRYTVEQMHLGVVIFSPIVYGHQFHASNDMPGDYLSWKLFNDEMLLRCSRVRVLRLDGWRSSAGIEYEIDFARRHGIPIEYDGVTR